MRCSTLLPTIHPQSTRQFASAQQIVQLEGLAVAISWGFESPFPHQVTQGPDCPVHKPSNDRTFSIRTALIGIPVASLCT